MWAPVEAHAAIARLGFGLSVLGESGLLVLVI